MNENEIQALLQEAGSLGLNIGIGLGANGELSNNYVLMAQDGTFWSTGSLDAIKEFLGMVKEEGIDKIDSFSSEIRSLAQAAEQAAELEAEGPVQEGEEEIVEESITDLAKKKVKELNDIGQKDIAKCFEELIEKVEKAEKDIANLQAGAGKAYKAAEEISAVQESANEVAPETVSKVRLITVQKAKEAIRDIKHDAKVLGDRLKAVGDNMTATAKDFAEKGKAAAIAGKDNLEIRAACSMEAARRALAPDLGELKDIQKSILQETAKLEKQIQTLENEVSELNQSLGRLEASQETAKNRIAEIRDNKVSVLDMTKENMRANKDSHSSRMGNFFDSLADAKAAKKAEKAELKNLKAELKEAKSSSFKLKLNATWKQIKIAATKFKLEVAYEDLVSASTMIGREEARRDKAMDKINSKVMDTISRAGDISVKSVQAVNKISRGEDR